MCYNAYRVGGILKKFFFFCLCFLGMMGISSAADINTLGELRANYNDLLQQQAENEAKSEAAKAEIAQKEAAIKQAEADIHQAEADMQEATDKIEESNERIVQLTSEAERVLLYLQQMQGENAYVEYVTGASTMTDLITRIAAVEQISDSIQTTMKNLEEEIKRNEELKEELKQKQDELSEQIDSYQKTIEQRYSDLASYDKYALDIDTQVEVAKKQVETYETLCHSEVGRTDDDVLLSDCSNIPVNSGWLKPLNYGVITSTWGYRTHPVTGVKYSFHNALDIGGNAEGTPIYAAAAGVVAAKVERYSCGGNMLYINVNVNGEEYTTYYYHLLSFNVDVGDVVTQNTIIGYVGGGYSTSSAYGGYDNCTTGAHLHFGVAKGYYNVNTGIVTSNIITPPGFPNMYGWTFTSRTQMYG